MKLVPRLPNDSTLRAVAVLAIGPAPADFDRVLCTSGCSPLKAPSSSSSSANMIIPWSSRFWRRQGLFFLPNALCVWSFLLQISLIQSAAVIKTLLFSVQLPVTQERERLHRGGIVRNADKYRAQTEFVTLWQHLEERLGLLTGRDLDSVLLSWRQKRLRWTVSLWLPNARY